jgi:hypothetical protein
MTGTMNRIITTTDPPSCPPAAPALGWGRTPVRRAPVYAPGPMRMLPMLACLPQAAPAYTPLRAPGLYGSPQREDDQ